MQLWGPCIDLFCGAGGLSCGFAQAGFDIRVGIDVDASALLTFERNHPQALAIKEDVARLTGDKLRELAGSETVLGMIGGPPCQGFSLAGNHDPDDVRNLLPYEYARLLKEAQPAFFLMENVKGLLSKKQHIHFDAIRDLFSAAGYRLEWKLLNAWDYGVAQTRERVFIVGFRSDLEVAFEWPPPDPSRPVLRDAIGDLPDPAEDETALMNHTLSNPRPVSMENRLRNAGKGVAMFDCKVQDWEKPCKTVTAHLSKDVDLAHPGMLPNHAGHLFPNVREESRYDQTNRRAGWDDPSFTITAHSRSAGLHPNHGPVPADPAHILHLVSLADADGVIPLEALEAAMPTRIRGLKGRQKVGSWQKPNPTITANAGFYAGAHYHPELTRPRRFTVRECARIQSFPDTFVFYGSLSAQYRQVGNAVPPKLAHALARQIANALSIV
ncbi:DNA cytosine methyltransferase [Paenibacillus sp. JMULE4]|uniref:DNA cytosine methyltransferase n=1 Tax=Paenibacillus sp. JMULE4 TaxID=2518342 RepID=UPI00157631F8|nr:DNA cytosine methyltransferase [Paenibacillus sp. JMULE4]NTZ20757.1 DNA cytosine methyltransferase [Paenibacillus sp. JMULE4]